MLRNHQKALDLIFSHYKEELTIDFVSNVHEAILATGDYVLDDEKGPGAYRGDDCSVLRTDGTRKYFLYDTLIPEAMKNLVLKLNADLKQTTLNQLNTTL